MFFHDMLNEFLDEFYMDEDAASRQARLDAAPAFTGRPVFDAWLCAAGEHLALRWGLRVPPWTSNDAGFRLIKPDYGGADEMPSLRKLFEKESPHPSAGATFSSRKSRCGVPGSPTPASVARRGKQFPRSVDSAQGGGISLGALAGSFLSRNGDRVGGSRAMLCTVAVRVPPAPKSPDAARRHLQFMVVGISLPESPEGSMTRSEVVIAETQARLDRASRLIDDIHHMVEPFVDELSIGEGKDLVRAAAETLICALVAVMRDARRGITEIEETARPASA